MLLLPISLPLEFAFPLVFKHQVHCAKAFFSSLFLSGLSTEFTRQAQTDKRRNSLTGFSGTAASGYKHQAQAEAFREEGCETEKGKCQGHWIPRHNRLLVVYMKVWCLD